MNAPKIHTKIERPTSLSFATSLRVDKITLVVKDNNYEHDERSPIIDDES